MNEIARIVASPDRYVHSTPLDGEYTVVRTVRFGEPLAAPGTDATITLS